jgi:hypothetical protein
MPSLIQPKPEGWQWKVNFGCGDSHFGRCWLALLVEADRLRANETLDF